MRSDGTDQVKIAADKSWSMGTPTWSPDGKRIAYVSKTEFNSPTLSIEVNDWQNARAETIFSDSHLTPVLHWLPDGRLIYVLANDENWHPRLKPVDGLAATIRKDFPALETHHARKWLDYAN